MKFGQTRCDISANITSSYLNENELPATTDKKIVMGKKDRNCASVIKYSNDYNKNLVQSKKCYTVIVQEVMTFNLN